MKTPSLMFYHFCFCRPEIEEEGESETPTTDLVVKEWEGSPVSAAQRRTELWFQDEAFVGLETEEDEDAEIERMMEIARKRKGFYTVLEVCSTTARARTGAKLCRCWNMA